MNVRTELMNQSPRQRMWLAVEWGLLALAAPFLLLPTTRPRATLLVLGLLCMFWLIALIRRQPWPVTPFNGALLLFTVMVGVGTLTTTLPALTVAKATGLVLGLAVFRAVAQARGTRGVALALGGVILAGMGVWALGMLDLQWPAKVPVLQAWLDRLPQHVMRLPGTPAGGISPNQLAGMLVLLLPVALAALLGGKCLGHRWLLSLLGLAGVVVWGITLFLTQSRGGWIGGAAGVLAFCTLWGLGGQRRWQRVVGLALPLLAIVAVATVLLYLGPDRIGQLLYGTAEGSVETAVGAISFKGRVEIWSRALYTIYDFPFTGRGLGTFRQMTPLMYPLFLVSPEKDIAHAHNVFLQVAVDLGLPGLVGYLALLLVAAWVGWQGLRRGGGGRWLAVGVLAGLLGFHVYGMADTLALGSKPSFLLWWVLGLLAAESEG